MDTRSQHLLFDAVCKRDFNSQDINKIKEIIEKHLTVLERVEYKFTPHGETIVFILSESHFTIHTYPENKYISMDIYICNLNIDLSIIVNEIKQVVPFEKVESKTLRRGYIGNNDDRKNLSIIYITTIAVACCSILYEFLLAQSLSTTMGNTALRYNLTIGLFIASMGFGALLFKKMIKNDLFKEFIKIELLLSVVGGVAPVLVLLSDYVFNLISKTFHVSFFSFGIQTSLFLVNHSFIFVVGFLSGLELPLLIEMGKKFKAEKGHQVLAFDYLGTLLGAILFPILILPNFHLFTIGYVVSFINILLAMMISFKMKVESRKYKILTWIMLSAWFLVIFNSEKINQFIVDCFYFGGK